MRWPCVLAVLGAFAGCVDKSTSGAFDAMPLDGVFTVGVSAQVHVARDRDGVAHILAQTLADAAFVQGFVMAHDRLPQMDLLRRYAAGTLAELYGADDPGAIDSDLAMRMFRMTAFAEQALRELQRGGAATSRETLDRQQLVLSLERFAAGVNAYALQLSQGLWTIDPALAATVDPARFVPWTPVDSLVIARLLALAQSWSVPFELEATELYQQLRATYDLAASPPATLARRGISRDLLRFTPIGRDLPGGAPGPAAPPPAAAAAVLRPIVPPELLASARATLAAPGHAGALGALGSAGLVPTLTGATAWAIGDALTGQRGAYLASDLHLALTNPSMYYPTHLIVARIAETDPTLEIPLDLLGVTVPGVPGMIYGSNGQLAWAPAGGKHDVNDVYLEDIAACGAASCVAWTDPAGVARQVEITQRTEELKIGRLGELTGTRLATYEVVPHHGPIIPAVDRTTHALTPRTGPRALSVAYAGDQPTQELLVLYRLATTTSVADGLNAFAGVAYGGQGLTMIDTGGHVGWITAPDVPVRKPAAHRWDPRTRQDELAPFFVLPGNGDGDWLPAHPLAPWRIPKAYDPARGFVVSSDADPIGATFDGLPLNQGVVAGDPVYLGVAYDTGLRADRIATRLRELRDAKQPVTGDDVAALLHDRHASLGAKLAPVLAAALARLDDLVPAPPLDVLPFLDGLTAIDRARLVTARRLLASWSFAAPAASAAPDPDSAATAVFHTWLRCFIARALADELAVIGSDVWRLGDEPVLRIVYALLTDPRSFVTSPSTQQPILCDDYASAGPDDSCTKLTLQAMIDAIAELESTRGFANPDPAAWRWGQLHQLVIRPLHAAPELALPGPRDLAQGGFPTAGDRFVAHPDDRDARALVPRRPAGEPALRWLAYATPGAVAVRWALPGGTIYDRRSPHYRDLLDRAYRADALIAAPSTIAEINGAGETRWVFR
jgi:penicillin G amidase